MQYVLNALVLGYLIFFIWNFDVLIFLMRPNISALTGYQLYATKPRLNVKLSAVAYGYVIRRGLHRVVLEAPTLYDITYLNITPFTKIIGMKDLKYGEQILVYGKLTVVLGKICMVPTRIICCNNEKKIKKAMYSRLSICLWIAVILEVVYYVIYLRL